MEIKKTKMATVEVLPFDFPKKVKPTATKRPSIHRFHQKQLAVYCPDFTLLLSSVPLLSKYHKQYGFGLIYSQRA